MSNTPQKLSPDEISLLFAQLSPQDVAEFYNGYQQWLRQHQIANLQTHIARVRLQVAENNRQMQQAHPSPIALASLARLQANGVTDFDLLDRMLERGEAWLDNTMQHLDYCEKFDFIRGNYTEWCEHALEGAYDWIDSMHKVSIEAAKLSPQPTTQSSTMETANNASSEMLNKTTEETFLQKLMSEEDVSLLDTKLEIPSVPPSTSDDIPDVETQIITSQPHAADIPTQIIAPQPHVNLENTIPTAAIPHSTAQDQTTASTQPYATPELAVNVPLKQHLEAVDPTPVLVEETSATATESEMASTLTSAQEVSTLTPEEPVDSTPLPVNETSTPFAEHIPAAPASAAILPSSTDTPTDTTTVPDASSSSAEPATTSAHTELQPSTREITTTHDEHHLDSIPSTLENTTEQNIPTDIPPSPSLASEPTIAQHTSTDVPLSPFPASDSPELIIAQPIATIVPLSPDLPEHTIAQHTSTDSLLSPDSPEATIAQHLSTDSPLSPDSPEATIAQHLSTDSPLSPDSPEATIAQHLSTDVGARFIAPQPHAGEASPQDSTLLPENIPSTHLAPETASGHPDYIPETATHTSPANDNTPGSTQTTTEHATPSAQTPTREVSDAPTIPEFPTMPVPQPREKTTEPAASAASAASTEPTNTTNDTPGRWDNPQPSESNTPSGKPRENTQQPSAPLSTAQPPKKRNFFQRLFRKSPRN
jgi:hypothetical protein